MQKRQRREEQNRREDQESRAGPDKHGQLREKHGKENYSDAERHV